LLEKDLALPDVHYREPDIAFQIQKVGVSSIRMPVAFLTFGGKPAMATPVFDAYIDLPISLKGINASRNYEVVMETMRRREGDRNKLEDICAAIAEDLLDRHEYSTRSEVKARTEIFLPRTSPITQLRTLEPYSLEARATAIRKGDVVGVKKNVGVGAIGVTACPCAQEVLLELSMKELKETFQIDDRTIRILRRNLPLGTHMQRCHASLSTDLPQGYDLDALELVKIVEDSVSVGTYGLLKRVDEAEVVRRALKSPRFAEDSVRIMARSFVERFPDFPDETKVVFSTKSFESIHKHDFEAELRTTLKELKIALRQNNRARR
jgi:GTP cyclohydrolase-4